jgi:uncharacterized protein YceK
MRFTNVLLVFFLLSLLSGCATIVHGTTQDINITTDPSGADLNVDGSEHYKSPAKITMKRKEDHMIEVAMEGYQKETVNIKSVISGAVAGNILAGGIIGWGVDAASGGQYRLVPENVDLRLHQIVTQAVAISKEPMENIENKLDQVKKLRDKGKITEEEYNKMRAEILANPSKTKISGSQPAAKTIATPLEPPKPITTKPKDKLEGTEQDE